MSHIKFSFIFLTCYNIFIVYFVVRSFQGSTATRKEHFLQFFSLHILIIYTFYHLAFVYPKFPLSTPNNDSLFTLCFISSTSFFPPFFLLHPVPLAGKISPCMNLPILLLIFLPLHITDFHFFQLFFPSFCS